MNAIKKILASDASLPLKISKLQNLALRSYPSSPNQKAVIAAYRALEKDLIMYGYKAFYNGKSIELYAESLFAAKQKAVAAFKVSAKKQHMVSVVLCEKNGEVVSHSSSEF